MSHLFSVRQGKDFGWWTAPLAPIYLGADIARGVVRVPVVSLPQIVNDVKTLPFLEPFQSELCTAQKMISEYQEDLKNGTSSTISISMGQDKRSRSEMAISFLTYIPTLPLKWVLSPMALDMFGKNSWEMMNRSARMLFHDEKEFNSGSPHTQPSGGLHQFMSQFEKEVSREPETWEITVIGHSMGTIVMNEMIRRFNINYANIVYMAGATSVRDYEDTIFPYLETHQETEVYHLTLHPIAEIRERWWMDSIMRGSLLMWVDQFLSQPQTRLDRTVGKFTNLMSTVHDTPGMSESGQFRDLRRQIHIKAFGSGNGEIGPQKHGDFNDAAFWKPTFWAVDKESGKIPSLECLDVR
ncbi:MAG: hypothetical protein AAB300_02520 [Nitrospirota bacterium]